MRIDKNDPFASDFDDRDYAGKNLYKLGLTDEPLPKLPPGNTYGFRTPSFTQQWYDRLYGPTGTRPSASGQAASHTGQEAYRHSASDTASGTTARGNGTDNPLFGTERPTGFKPQLAKDEAFPWNPDQSAHSSRPEYTPLADASSRTTRIDAGQPPLVVPTGQEKNEPFGQTFSTPDAVGDQNTKTYTVMDFFYPIYWASVVHNGCVPPDLLKDGDIRKTPAYSANTPGNTASSTPSNGLGTTRSNKVASADTTPFAGSSSSQQGAGAAASVGSTISSGQTNAVSSTGQFVEAVPYIKRDKDGNPVYRYNCLPVKPSHFLPHTPNTRTGDLPSQVNASINSQLGNLFGHPYRINFIQLAALEGGVWQDTYVPWSPNSKNNRSGVTVGLGIDFGQKKEETLQAMQLPPEVIDRLRPALGLRGEAACRYNQENGHHFSADEINQISQSALVWHTREAIKHWDLMVLKNRTLYPNAPFLHQMPEAVQTLIISRYHNEGAGWVNNHKALKAALLRRDWKGTIGALENLAKEFSQKRVGWKSSRFTQEADYLRISFPPEILR